MNEALNELNARVEQFLSAELPAMADKGVISEPQLFETLGVIGLWTRAAVGPFGGGADVQQVVEGFVRALRETYPGDTLAFPQRVHAHLEEAFRANPALAQFRSYVESALKATPPDDASRAAVMFLAYATQPASSAEAAAYFDVLLGGL